MSVSCNSSKQLSLPMSAENGEGEGGKISKDVFLAISYLQNMSFGRFFSGSNLEIRWPNNCQKIKLFNFAQFCVSFCDTRLVHVLWYHILGNYFEMILQYFGMKKIIWSFYYDF